MQVTTCRLQNTVSITILPRQDSQHQQVLSWPTQCYTAATVRIAALYIPHNTEATSDIFHNLQQQRRLIVIVQLQFVYEVRVAELVLGSDAPLLGGPVANSGGWLQASDETHCGKMIALQVRPSMSRNRTCAES